MTRSTESFLLALGGLVGFACAFLAALTGGSGLDGALMKASVAMIATAFLVKVFLFMTRTALREARNRDSSIHDPQARRTDSVTAETR